MTNTSAGWLPIGLTVFILLATWLANCILLGGALQTASSGRIVPVAYFFVGSQAIAALLYVTLNLPPAAVGLIFGSTHVQSRIHVFCLYSTYLDTLFCNLTFLQTFFSSLDAYLRLRNPTFYLTSARRRPALWLKVGSPWLVAGLQAIGQLALSDRDQVSLHFASIKSADDQEDGHSWGVQSLQTTCLLPDPNFLIIRTAIAYALPLIVCIILVGLQLRCLRGLRNYSYESLQALLHVRSGVQSLRSGRRTTSVNNSLYAKRQHQSASIPVTSASSVLYIPEQASLRDLRSDHVRSPVAHRTYGTQQLLTNSLHLDHQCTFETLIPDGTLSTHHLPRVDNSQQLFAPSTHVSHVLLPTSTMPFFELHSIDTTNMGTDVIYATTQGSIINCPAHGPISMTMTDQATSPTNFAQGTMCSSQLSDPEVGTHSPEELKSNDPMDVKQTSNREIELQIQNVERNTERENSEPKVTEPTLLRGNSIVKSTSSYSMPPLCTPGSPRQNCVLTSESEPTLQPSLCPPTTVHEQNDYLGATAPLWLRAYKGEQLAVAINLVSCIIAVGTWSPFILSTLAHGLCQPLKFPVLGHSNRARPVYTMHPALLNLPQSTQPPSRCMIQTSETMDHFGLERIHLSSNILDLNVVEKSIFCAQEIIV
ncbi:unnamed protein product [Echinostoma caproni]|uniref:G_PROTEIN_RECEP_F1_2 domain-containing protein n=1 Tax=Echinostoma caproni TaxID=27848 RepID=A0A183A614_9TREM|nr:unnamed protein product [Echinostoma caproni]